MIIVIFKNDATKNGVFRDSYYRFILIERLHLILLRFNYISDLFYLTAHNKMYFKAQLYYLRDYFIKRVRLTIMQKRDILTLHIYDRMNFQGWTAIWRYIHDKWDMNNGAECKISTSLDINLYQQSLVSVYDSALKHWGIVQVFTYWS